MKTKSAVLNIFTSYFAKIHEKFEYPVVLFGANMHLLYKNFSQLFIVIFLVSCGGGGGGGGGGNAGDGYGNTNNAPTINNSSLAISVIENQTSAFTVSASDTDGDSISFSISDNDSALFNISTGGVVTFITAPDFEIPTDANADNVYTLTVQASDGSLSDSKVFDVTVTNDTSDDVTTSAYDGKVIGASYMQSASVCTFANNTGCDDATNTSTTAEDGTFSLSAEDGNTIINSINGFDPDTNTQFDNIQLSIDAPVTDQNIIVSPLSSLHAAGTLSYQDLKAKLGIDENFMIRFDDPMSSLSDAASNKAAVINTQLMILAKSLEVLTSSTDSNFSARFIEIASSINSRSGNETTLGDTTFIRNLLLEVGIDNNAVLENSSAALSSFLQKVYAESADNAHIYFASSGWGNLNTLLQQIVAGTANQADIDNITFNTINWLNDNSTFSGTFNDVEEGIQTTSYSVGNSGSSYYTIDNVNADSTALIIYAKVGDKIQFEPTSSSVFAGHPFEMSTLKDDTSGTQNIGSAEGWDQNNNTLTVSSSTPTTLYPHCGVHSGMYTNGKIEIVESFASNLIDIESSTSSLQVKGTVLSGPYKGASGFTYKVYLRTADAGSSQHEHTFDEYPGLTFFMPADQGYHGSSTQSEDAVFKTKSHY